MIASIAADISFETIRFRLEVNEGCHKNGRITAHYSRAELSNLVAAASACGPNPPPAHLKCLFQSRRSSVA
jgi:hypothetical protein